MQRPSVQPRARSRHRRRHTDAVIQAEVRRLARALSAAVDADKIRQLPADLYARGNTSAQPAPPRGS